MGLSCLVSWPWDPCYKMGGRKKAARSVVTSAECLNTDSPTAIMCQLPHQCPRKVSFGTANAQATAGRGAIPGTQKALNAQERCYFTEPPPPLEKEGDCMLSEDFLVCDY